MKQYLNCSICYYNLPCWGKTFNDWAFLKLCNETKAGISSELLSKLEGTTGPTNGLLEVATFNQTYEYFCKFCILGSSVKHLPMEVAALGYASAAAQTPGNSHKLDVIPQWLPVPVNFSIK